MCHQDGQLAATGLSHALIFQLIYALQKRRRGKKNENDQVILLENI